MLKSNFLIRMLALLLCLSSLSCKKCFLKADCKIDTYNQKGSKPYYTVAIYEQETQEDGLQQQQQNLANGESDKQQRGLPNVFATPNIDNCVEFLRVTTRTEKTYGFVVDVELNGSPTIKLKEFVPIDCQYELGTQDGYSTLENFSIVLAPPAKCYYKKMNSPGKEELIDINSYSFKADMDLLKESLGHPPTESFLSKEYGVVILPSKLI